MSIEDNADKPTIVFTKDDENLVPWLQCLHKCKLIKYDGKFQKASPGRSKKGMLILKINQKDAIKDVNWPALGELMISAANGE